MVKARGHFLFDNFYQLEVNTNQFALIGRCRIVSFRCSQCSPQGFLMCVLVLDYVLKRKVTEFTGLIS